MNPIETLENLLRAVLLFLSGALEKDDDAFTNPAMHFALAGVKSTLERGLDLLEDIEIRQANLQTELAQMRAQRTEMQQRIAGAEQGRIVALRNPISLAMFFMAYAPLSERHSGTPDQAPEYGQAKMGAIKFARTLYGYVLADAKIFVETLPEIPHVRNLVDAYYRVYNLNKGRYPLPNESAHLAAYSAYCASYASTRTSLPESERLHGALSDAEFVAIAFELAHTIGDAGLASFPAHETHLRAALTPRFLAPKD